MPEPGSKVLFKNYHRQMQVPFVIYADFEAITEKFQGCNMSDQQSYTDKYQKHTGFGYCYKVVCCYNDKYSRPVQVYRGEDSIEKFMYEILKEEEYCRDIIQSKFHKPLRMSPDEEQMFNAAEVCHICKKQYQANDIRVRDHCHITGKYRGSAHQDCNLKLQVDFKTYKLPVIFHNLKGYDTHFIMQEIGKISKEKQLDINCIPNNMEKYDFHAGETYCVY